MHPCQTDFSHSQTKGKGQPATLPTHVLHDKQQQNINVTLYEIQILHGHDELPPQPCHHHEM